MHLAVLQGVLPAPATNRPIDVDINWDCNVRWWPVSRHPRLNRAVLADGQ